ncbi:MAG: Fpg/Nei family DNA glycosylase [Firmicutes bacterium]|nr:Fpg/Nei family DNA glycosylase [Bacillota bacterium]
MPELPEILNLSRQMDRELRNQEIQSVSVLQEKCVNLPVDDFINKLRGKRVGEITHRGKWVFMRLEPEAWLLLNLGMGGNVILHRDREGLPDKYQLLIEFADGAVLSIGFWWFGYVHLVDDEGLKRHQMTARLGPTPLRDPGFTRDCFINLLKGRKGSVKSFLTNQANVAGIGNVYIQDTLFRACLHPLRGVQSLTEEEKSLLYDGMMETLREAADLGGLAHEKDLYDRPGGFEDFLVGYREGKECPRCGTVIVKIKTGSTSSYICPQCQPEGK